VGKKRIWCEYTGVVWLGFVVEGVHHLSVFMNEWLLGADRTEELRGGWGWIFLMSVISITISSSRHPFFGRGPLFWELDSFAWVTLTREGRAFFVFGSGQLGVFALGQLRGSYSFTFLFLTPHLIYTLG
jgi:hypothetical protein